MRNFYPFNFLKSQQSGIKVLSFIIGFFSLLYFTSSANAQSIAVTNVATTPVCAGSNVTITFDVTNGTGAANYFTNSTSYQVYLSDASGTTFSAVGGTFSISASYSTNDNGSTTGLTANFTIPAATAAGSGYKIAIGSTSPSFDASGGAGTSAAFTVNALVTPTVSITANPGNTICAGNSVTFTANPTNGGATPSYQWQVNGSNVGSNSDTYTTTTLNNGDVVTCTLTSNAVCTTTPTANSNSITMTVNPILPVSVSIGASATTICAGTSVTFTATPTNGGTTPSYQWQVNGANVGTNSSTFTSTTLANNDAVTVILTSNASPCATGNPATSNSITMTVNPLLTPSVSITANPGNTICAGTSVTFTANPINGGSTPTYQWKKNAVNIPGATASTYTTSVINNGDVFTVQMTSNATCANPSIVVSPFYTMTVNPLPTANAGPGLLPICQGATSAPMGGSVGGGATGGTWSGGAGTWTNANDPGNATYTAGLSESGTITLTLTTNGGSCGTTSVTKQLTVNPTPTASVTNSGQIICSGANITTMVISGSVAGTIYNWTRDNTGSVTGIAASGSGDISGTLTNTTSSPVVVTFTITPIASGCSGTPITATVTVNPTATATATNSNQTICSGSTIATMVISGNVGSATYNWTRDNTAGVTGITASGSGNISGALTNITNSPITVTFTITPSANGCPGTSITATVLVYPTPTASVTNFNQIICSGNAIATMVITGNVAGATYNWTRDNTGSVTGIAGSGSGNISGTLTNTTSSPVTVTFTITPTANGCSGTPVTAKVLVNPTPTINSVGNQTVCNNTSTTAINFSGTGTTYTWTNTNTAIGLAASGSGNIAAFTATNPGSTPITATITVTPNANGCSGSSTSFTITVNPTLVPSVSISASSTTICSGTSVTFTATPTNGGSTPSYQ